MYFKWKHSGRQRLEDKSEGYSMYLHFEINYNWNISHRRYVNLIWPTCQAQISALMFLIS